MLLTISTTHRPATDLGYLLHKHPDRFQSFDLSFESLDDLKLAPFHLLATEGKVHVHQNHVWHMETRWKASRWTRGYSGSRRRFVHGPHGPRFVSATLMRDSGVTATDDGGMHWRKAYNA